MVGRRGRRGGLRLPGQDAAGVPGAARIRRGVPGRGAPSAAAPAAGLPAACVAVVVSRRLVSCCSSSCGRAIARPYIGGSQHDSIVELALGYNGFGRLTGDEPGGLGNLNFDVGWGRLFGHGMGADIAWLLPAAVICLARGIWSSPGGHRARTSRARGADPVGRLAGRHRGGVQLHERHRAPLLHGGARARDRRVRSASAQHCCGATAPTSVPRPRWPAPSSSPRSWRRCCWPGHERWMPWLRAAVAVGGVGAAVLLLVAGRLRATVARAVAGLAVAACLAAPAAYSVATAATPHSGAIPSAGPSRAGACRSRCGRAARLADARARR